MGRQRDNVEVFDTFVFILHNTTAASTVQVWVEVDIRCFFFIRSWYEPNHTDILQFVELFIKLWFVKQQQQQLAFKK